MTPVSHGMQYDTFRAMNSEILLVAEGPDADQGFETVRRFIETSEQRFTRFSQTSELAHINQNAGSWMTVSAEMFDLIETALACYQATGGLFDPSILAELEQAGYTKSMEELRITGAEPQPHIYPRSDRAAFDSIELRRSDLSILIRKEMRIDLGGIAKGWIAERAARILAKFAPNCAVNAGGDMFLIGSPTGNSSWEIGLEDPRHSSLDLMTLQVEGGAIATSSVTKRVWQQGNVTRHHLIDPRSSEPAQTRWLSVTVLAPSAATAEAFAKAILIAEPEIARELIDKNPQITYLAVDGNGQIWVPEKGDVVRMKIVN